MNPGIVSNLLLQAAPLLDADQLTQQDNGGWFLAFEGGQVIDVELDESVPRLVLTGDVGRLPDDDDRRRLEMMLAYNALWTAHGGVRTALDLERREVSLMLDVPLQQLDAQSLTGILAGFREVMAGWTETLKAQPGTPAASDLSALANFGLRV